MRRKVGLALVLTVILIGGATAARFFKHSAPENVYIADNTVQVLDTSTTTADVADLGDLASEATTTSLTTTDLVSRQLFGDYINLASTGAATPENISALAARYTDAITKMAQANSIMATDLNIVPDSSASLSAYRSWFQSTVGSYRRQIDAAFGNAIDISDLGPRLTALGEDTAAIYREEAEQFKTAAVPQSLLADHLALTNIYFGNAIAFHAVAEASQDPFQALAGLATSQQNDQAESLLIDNITKTLGLSGIISGSQ